MSEHIGLIQSSLQRRRFMMTGLVSGFTMATTTVLAQAIHTDATGLDAGEVQIPVEDGHLPGYFARPQGNGPFPVILVIEEVFGVNEYIRDVCRRFAQQGYLAVAPELYARVGNLAAAKDGAEVMAIISRAPDSQINADLDSTTTWAGANRGDISRLGINGFCRGGRVTWLYGEYSPRLRAAVSWYGQIVTPDTAIQPHTALEDIGDLKCPLLGLYGSKDPMAPYLQQMRDAAAKAGKTVEIIVYPGAGHAFHSDYRPSYVASAATDGWTHTLAWFKKYL